MMHISAKTGSDIKTLIELLIGNQKGLLAESDETIVTNLRHYEALQKAGKALEATRASELPSDIVAEDLRRRITTWDLSLVKSPMMRFWVGFSKGFASGSEVVSG